MMKTLFIGLKDIVLLIRDKKALVTLIATPLILTLVLGMAMSSLWGGGNEQSLGTLLVVNNDPGGHFSKILIEEVYGSQEFSQRFKVEVIADQLDGENQVQHGKAIGIVTIPEDFSLNLLRGMESELAIIGDVGNSFLPPAIVNVTEMFVEEVMLKLVAVNLSGQYVPEGILTNEMVEEVIALLDSRENLINVIKDTSYVGVNDILADNVNPMAYYSAAMAVMYLLFNANLGGKRILQEREQGTLQRLKVGNVSTWQFILGKTIGIYFSAFLQLIILIFFTSRFYNVDWGGQTKVLLFSAIVVLATSGIGIFIASLSSSSSGAEGLGSFVILSMSALGGSMFPIYAMPPIMQFFSKLTFNRWAIEGFTQMMFLDASLKSLQTHMLTLLGIGLVTLAVAIFRLTKMEVN